MVVLSTVAGTLLQNTIYSYFCILRPIDDEETPDRPGEREATASGGQGGQGEQQPELTAEPWQRRSCPLAVLRARRKAARRQNEFRSLNDCVVDSVLQFSSTMEDLSHAASIFVSLSALLSPAVAAAAGVVPRVGPGRALILGLTSRFLRSYPPTQRSADAKSLSVMIKSAASDNYIVVTGPKGVGKTRLFNSVVGNYFGVIQLSVAPATMHDALVTNVLRAVARIQYMTFDSIASAVRISWFHQFFFRSPITVILHAAERKPDEKPAAIDSAARVLVGHGLRVIVDASTNSMAEEAVKTMREIFLQVEPMERGVLEQMEELAELRAALKEAGLADVVWKVLGGLPAAYLQLNRCWIAADQKELESVATNYLHSRLSIAISDVNKSCAARPDLEELYDLFVSREFVDESILRVKKLVRPSPDKVLRAIAVKGQQVRLIPVDNAKRLVLRHKLHLLAGMPTLEEMRNLS